MTKLFGYMTYILILLVSILLAGILSRLLSRSARLPMRSPAGDYDGGIKCEACNRAASYSSRHRLRNSGGMIAYYWCEMHAPAEATSFEEDERDAGNESVTALPAYWWN
jgi:hypothetical protein